MPQATFDVIVVGTGPGGATVAREMARRNQRVLMLERGPGGPVRGDLRQYIAGQCTPGRSLLFTGQGLGMVRGITVGGSSLFYYGDPHGVKWSSRIFVREACQKGAVLETGARAILKQAGARSIYKTGYLAAHPGGTVKIGEHLDARLATGIDRLHVCDCSVIPEPWGLPPTLTLVGLGKHLAKILCGEKKEP